MLKQEHYIDVQVCTSVASEELAGLFHQCGLLGTWEERGIIHLYWEKTAWSPSLLNEIRNAITQLGDALFQDSITIQDIPWEDWNAQWATSVEPIHIGRRIVIRPSWKSIMRPPHAIELILDPKQAFGTGHHATTQLLITWLEDLIRGDEKILDVGTGSGILAMIAIRLGAKAALGIDNDPIAIDCAKDYASLNGFGKELELHTRLFENLQAEPFDIILANLDGPTLLRSHHTFQQHWKTGTTLLLSGILEEDEHEMVTLFSEDGWQALGVRRQEGWSALYMQPSQYLTKDPSFLTKYQC